MSIHISNYKMEIIDIASLSDLKKITGKNDRTFLLLFKGGTERSDCALKALSELDSSIAENIIFLKADVSRVKDIHPEYGIGSVPALLEFGSVKLKNIFRGCNSKDFYISAISGYKTIISGGEGKSQKNITVYSTPACTWCNTLKSYLKDRKINYRDIDVSVDQNAAEQMVNKSGQQGVPQIDIDGQVVVGFDKMRIDNLLES